MLAGCGALSLAFLRQTRSVPLDLVFVPTPRLQPTALPRGGTAACDLAEVELGEATPGEHTHARDASGLGPAGRGLGTCTHRLCSAATAAAPRTALCSSRSAIFPTLSPRPAPADHAPARLATPMRSRSRWSLQVLD